MTKNKTATGSSVDEALKTAVSLASAEADARSKPIFWDIEAISGVSIIGGIASDDHSIRVEISYSIEKEEIADEVAV